MPGHHCSARKKETANKVTVIPKSVYLIEAIVEIRRELAAAFKIKFPFIQMSGFYFIKGERNTIFRPAVEAARQLDFSHISAKNLCGQGRLVHGN